MKKLSCLILSIIFCLCYYEADAQLGKLKNKIKKKVEQRVDKKTDKAIDDGLDKIEEGAQPNEEGGDGKVNENEENGEIKKTKEPALKSYSKYDFVPGDKIVYAEDFGQDIVGEFPLKWNTNGSGEIVTIEGHPGKWLKMTSGTKYESPYSAGLPENFTVEFDLLLDFKPRLRMPDLEFIVFNKEGRSLTYPPGIHLFMAPQAGTYSSEENNTVDRIRMISYDEKGHEFLRSKDQLTGEFYNNKTKPVHVSIWVQKQRVRVWINEVKMYDLPRALPEKMKLTNFLMETGAYSASDENYQYYLSNMKVAVAAPDTRSKLITEGKWSTTGILFDVNSDKIKPFSFGTLKEIATILKENPEVKVNITGHTDSDGEETSNLELSKRRAAAVKNILATEFGIDASRMETNGAGETRPVADNKTPEGKAQNRRVEFIKLGS